MHKVPAHLRSRISALGHLSRPLGEARAAVLARAIANDLVAGVTQGRDPERLLDAWLTRIACEIAAKTQAAGKAAESPRSMRSLKELLPEID